MNQFKKCKVVMLPTDKVQGRHILKCIKSFDLGMVDDFHNAEKEGNLFYGFHDISKEFESWNNKHWQPQHLYTLSDEKIKENDWFYETGFKQIGKFTSEIKRTIHDDSLKFLRKIIASTNYSLGLPRPSDSFIKKYCELGGIDEVLVEYRSPYDHNDPDFWKSFGDKVKIDWDTPKVAPDNTITIKKVKESWSREEVKDLVKEAVIDYERKKINFEREYPNWIDKWFEENL